MPIAIIYIAGAVLIAGALPLPYGYYTMLRFVGCAVFTFVAYVGFNRKAKNLPWAYALLAVAFNPFIKVHFQKELWMVMDVVAGALLLITARRIRSD